LSIVRGLALAHLSATALLLVVFLIVITWQRVAGSVVQRGAAPAPAYPTEAERSARLTAPAGPVAARPDGPTARGGADAPTSVARGVLDEPRVDEGAPRALSRSR